MVCKAFHGRITAFHYVTTVRFRPNCTFIANAQKRNGLADRVSHQLANGAVARAVAPTVPKLHPRQFNDDKCILVVSN
eukprot:3228509-Lingulodinium_polyedra.AAC.1